jgi:GNAT superfamily N-acetyltransferase
MIPGSAIPKIGMVLIGRVNSQMGAVAQQSKDLEQMNLIIYISNLKIVGVLLVESVTEGVKYHNDVAIEECKVVVGVSRIWTDPVYRRNGIAKRLLLAIKRCNHQSAAQCSDSCRIPPNRVAFSQPTSDGKMLAKWYLNDQTTDFIYYTDT